MGVLRILKVADDPKGPEDASDPEGPEDREGPEDPGLPSTTSYAVYLPVPVSGSA